MPIVHLRAALLKYPQAVNIVEFAPAGKCLRLDLGEAEALVTLEVGPRILYFGPKGGPNMLKVYPDGGSLGEHGMKHYGGHRLWYGPEDRDVTYQPDNDPVERTDVDGWLGFASRTNRYGIQKQISVRPKPKALGLDLRHVVTNRSTQPATLFPWALTVMAQGGTCLIPMPPFRAHTEDLLPAASMVLWSYTSLNDPRWTWGTHVSRLAQRDLPTPQKLGALIKQGYAAYANFGHLFIKRFDYHEGAAYPDLGCNFETFTNAEMLEVESVGPEVTLVPGESAELRESWSLILDAVPPVEDEACGMWLRKIVEGLT